LIFRIENLIGEFPPFLRYDFKLALKLYREVLPPSLASIAPNQPIVPSSIALSGICPKHSICWKAQKNKQLKIVIIQFSVIFQHSIKTIKILRIIKITVCKISFCSQNKLWFLPLCCFSKDLNPKLHDTF
jgi:hypothetical protein